MKFLRKLEATNDGDGAAALSDEELAQIAAAAPAALAEHARREEARRLAGEEEAKKEAERSRLAEVAALEVDYAVLGAQRSTAHAAFGAALIAAGRALEEYRQFAYATADVEARFEELRATPKPVRVEPFSADVLAAARALVPVVTGDLSGYLVDPLRMVWRTRPEVFYPQRLARP